MNRYISEMIVLSITVKATSQSALLPIFSLSWVLVTRLNVVVFIRGQKAQCSVAAFEFLSDSTADQDRHEKS